ncbi:MAG: hypothetical protein DI535_07605 [Citrobacter freundii]|nr:MAG: hypothetical protein DI535_07605 [Citrobacter freundii]
MWKLDQSLKIIYQFRTMPLMLDIMGRGGRQKDFWDLHTAHDYFEIGEMLAFYTERYPYGYSLDEIVEGLNRFEVADEDPTPGCLQGKHWELIKYDFFQWVTKG